MPDQVPSAGSRMDEIYCDAAWYFHRKGEAEKAWCIARQVLQDPVRLRDEQRAGLHMILSRSDTIAVSHGHQAACIYAAIIADARKEGRGDQVAHFRGLLEQTWTWLQEAKERELNTIR